MAFENIYTSTYYSAANTSFVFSAYLYAIGTQQINPSKLTMNNINVSVITQPLAKIDNKLKTKFSDITLNYKTMKEALKENASCVKNTGLYLSDLSYTTVNKDTEEDPTAFYQEQLNIPAKEMIFTTAYTATNTSRMFCVSRL